MSASPVPPVAWVGTPRLTAGFDEFGRLDLWAHEQLHGDVRPLSVENLITLATRSSSAGAAARDSRSRAR